MDLTKAIAKWTTLVRSVADDLMLPMPSVDIKGSRVALDQYCFLIGRTSMFFDDTRGFGDIFADAKSKPEIMKNFIRCAWMENQGKKRIELLIKKNEEVKNAESLVCIRFYFYDDDLTVRCYVRMHPFMHIWEDKVNDVYFRFDLDYCEDTHTKNDKFVGCEKDPSALRNEDPDWEFPNNERPDQILPCYYA